MAKINLLPWREELRRQKKKDFLTAMGGLATLTLVAFGFVHTHIQGMQDYQEQRNAILTDEIARLDQKLGEIKNIEDTKNKLLAKIDLIQKLQESRPEAVHLMDEIPRNTPDGVFLTKFTQLAQGLVFEGKSQSNARVSAFMRAIDESNWLHSPVLEEIKAEDAKSTQSNFKLKATLGKQIADATKK
jgi:type IV pilus assembly protein PilN